MKFDDAIKKSKEMIMEGKATKESNQNVVCPFCHSKSFDVNKLTLKNISVVYQKLCEGVEKVKEKNV